MIVFVGEAWYYSEVYLYFLETNVERIEKEWKMKAIGYHGTCSKYRYNIEKDGLDPSKCKHRDDHWLGQGVYFFDYYKEQNEISVIIGTFQKEFAGYTTKRNYSERELQKKIMGIIGIKFKERQICVSKKECIKTTKLIYNEEEEVI